MLTRGASLIIVTVINLFQSWLAIHHYTRGVVPYRETTSCGCVQSDYLELSAAMPHPPNEMCSHTTSDEVDGPSRPSSSISNAMIADLSTGLRSKDPEIRLHGYRSIRKLGYSAAPLLPILLDIAADNASPNQCDAIQAIATIGDQRTVDYLLFIYRHPKTPQLAMDEVLKAISRFGPGGSGTLDAIMLVIKLNYLDYILHMVVQEQLVIIGNDAVPKLMKIALSDNYDIDVRITALNFIRTIFVCQEKPPRQMLWDVAQLLFDPHAEIRMKVCDMIWLGIDENQVITPYLSTLFTDRDLGVSLQAASAMLHLDNRNQRAVAVLLRALSSDSAEYRAEAALICSNIRTPAIGAAVPILMLLLDDPDTSVCLAALAALKSIRYRENHFIDKLRIIANNHSDIYVRACAARIFRDLR